VLDVHDSLPKRSRHAPRPELIDAIVLAAISATFSLWLSSQFGPKFFEAPAGNDVWFEADLPQVYESLSSLSATQHRHVAHPLYPLFATVPVSAINALGVSDRTALRLWMSGVAAAWAAALFACLRLQALRRRDAVVFTIAGLSSSTFVFWWGAPETFVIGSVTILAALILAALPGRPDDRLHVAALVATLGVTVTNGVTGVLTIATTHRPRRTALLVVVALAIALGLWAALHLVFPSLPFVLFYTDWERFLLKPESGGPLHVLRVLFAHSMVMPDIALTRDPKWGALMTVQHSAIGGSSVIGAVAAGCWLLLLGGGAIALARTKQWGPFERVLAGTLVAQVALHLIFGEQTFLYSPHVLPLLLLIAARSVSLQPRLGSAAIALAVVLIVAGGSNNLHQFRMASRFLDHGRPGIPLMAGDTR
jgi:hypothetical protein